MEGTQEGEYLLIDGVLVTRHTQCGGSEGSADTKAVNYRVEGEYPNFQVRCIPEEGVDLTELVLDVVAFESEKRLVNTDSGGRTKIYHRYITKVAIKLNGRCIVIATNYCAGPWIRE